MDDSLARLQAALSGRYAIERELGAGGMAMVYLAEDLKHHRPVAMKVLRAELTPSLGAERFLREIATTARLSHPHILPLLDSGEADGLLFYVMPYVEGESLRDRLTREKQLPLDDALQIAREVADALSHAHSRAVIHRDIKPENILLQSGHAVVADFGIARAVSAAGGTRLTETGLAVGTPAYMSPEQAAGDAEIDARSDLYALGCVLYEMLGGETPYTGPTPQAILAKKLSEPLPHITVVRETVPPSVEAAITRALARTPADRFATAQQFVQALQGPFGEPRVAVAPRRRRVRLLATSAVVAVLAVVGVLAWPLLRGGGEGRIASLAVLPPTDLSGDSTQEYFVLGLYDGLVAELQQIGTLGVISRTSSMAYRGTTKSVPQIASELGVDAVVETSVLKEGDSVHLRVQLIRVHPSERALWGHRYDAKLAGVLKLYGDVAKDIARETGAGLTTEEETRFATRREVNPQTYEAYVKGMYYIGKGTPEGAARGIALLREAIDRDPGDPLAWAGLAITYLYAAHGPDPQVDALPLAKAAAERAVRLDPTLTETMSALAFLKGYYDWDWATADSMYRAILTLNPSAAMAHYWYSWQLVLFDQMDSAIAEHIRAQQADPLNPLHTAWLGELYVMDGRPDEGMVEVRRAIALDSMFGEAYVVMTDAFVAKGQLDSALASAEHAWRIDHSWWYMVARVQVLMGRRDEARRAAAEYEAKPPTPWNAFGLAVVYANLGENDDAFRWLNYEHVHAWVPWVRVVLWMEPLRDDPRLPAFLEKVHVPPLRPQVASQ